MKTSSSDNDNNQGKKKILVLNNECSISGAEISLLSLAAHLSREKYSLIFILPGEGQMYDQLVSDHRVVLYPLKKIRRRNTGILRTAADIFRTGWKIAAFARKEKIDLVYSNTIQAQLYGIIVRLLTFKKVIWHVRDRNPNPFISRCCAAASSRILCISTFIYDQTPGGRKKTLLYNGIDTTYWSPFPKAPTLPGLPALPAGTLLVGQVGQLIPWKRPDDLIRAAAIVARLSLPVHFVILGNDMTHDHAGYIDDLKKLIHTEGLTDHITFAGFRANIRDYINQLDLLVHCAEDEPLGRVVLEAMALEKAVVAYRSGGCAEIITDDINGLLVQPRSIDTLSAAIAGLLQDEEKRMSLGKQARQEVIRRFSLSASVTAFETAVDTL
jgi:glycosyltransferase involved in cell wall biosynthesis